MVSFFKEKSSAAVFGIIIISVLTRAFFFTHPPQLVFDRSDGFIWYPLSLLSGFESGMSFLYFIIIVVQALRLNYALNDMRMFPHPTYAASLAYVLLTAIIPSWNNVTSALIINSMLIWLLYKFIKLYDSEEAGSLIFNIGLITGATVLLYFGAFPLVIVVFFALALLRPFRLNEWMILLAGILTPVYLFGGFLYLTDNLNILSVYKQPFTLRLINPANIPDCAVTFGIIVIAVLSGIFFWQINIGKMSIQVRNYWLILILMLVLVLPDIFVLHNGWPDALLLATVPAAAFISNAFIYPKNNLYPALLFWIFIALIVYNTWFVNLF